MDTLKDAIRLKKGVTPKGGIRVDHVFLLTPIQINRLDKAQVEGRRVQIRLSARQVAKNVNYTGRFIGALTLAGPLSLTARVLLTILSELTTGLFLVVLTKRLVAVVMLLEMDPIYTNMINVAEYRNAKAMVSI